MEFFRYETGNETIGSQTDFATAGAKTRVVLLQPGSETLMHLNLLDSELELPSLSFGSDL